MRLIEDNQVGRAAKSLLQSGIHPVNPQVIDTLHSLHPLPISHHVPQPPQQIPPVSFSTSLVSQVIRKRAPRGTAPGLSGWTESLLLPILTAPDLTDHLSLLLSDIASANLNDDARRLLLRSRLLPVRKKDGGVRPVVIGETFVRLAALCALRSLPNGLLQRTFAPRQFGIGLRNGVESAIHVVQSQLDHNPDHVALSLDIHNGFNSIERSELLKALYSIEALSPLWRLAHWCYGAPSHLFVHSGDSFTSITSARGSRQGCVLGSLLFCLGLQPLLDQAAVGLENVSIVAVVDDITIVGPPEGVITAFQRIHLRLPHLGLKLSGPKCSALLPEPLPSFSSLSSQHHVTLHFGSMPLLGAMVGKDTKEISQFAINKVCNHLPLLQAITHPALRPQNAMLLIPRINFLCHILAPLLIADV